MTKICVAIRLAEDGTRIGGIWFQLTPSYIYNYPEKSFSMQNWSL